MPKKIVISAGELSGDRIASFLVSTLKQKDPSIIFSGMGSKHLKDKGVSIVTDISAISTVGIFEPLLYIPKILTALSKMKTHLKTEKPDLFIAVDCQGFNMLLLKTAKKLGIKTCYFIPPQEWQWGSDKGGKKVIRLSDQILAIFQKGADFYQKLGGNVRYIGHPIYNMAKSTLSKSEFYKRLNQPVPKKSIAIFPGSRPQEFKWTAPVLFESAKTLQSNDPTLQLIVSCPAKKWKPIIQQLITEYQLKNTIIYEDNSYDLIKNVDLSLTKSGTITLEHALLKTPCLVAYKFHPISFWIIKSILQKKWKSDTFYMSLPNILAEKMIFPEFIQNNATADKISEKATDYLNDKKQIEKIMTELKQFTPQSDVFDAAAKAVIDQVKLSQA